VLREQCVSVTGGPDHLRMAEDTRNDREEERRSREGGADGNSGPVSSNPALPEDELFEDPFDRPRASER
jgi:hypothetical protein